MSKRLISVVMSVHNGGRYLYDAIGSVLTQTYADFEFIMIDDGSIDESLEVIQTYAKQDKRIRVIVNENNIGLTKSLNKGISCARGEFIARMDADDISLPERFSRQIQFLEANPDIDVVGCWIDQIGPDGRSIEKIWTNLSSVLEMRWACFFRTPLAHPTVIVRRQFFDRVGLYNDNYRTAQDYELWSRGCLSANYANVKQVLLRYRVHNASISQSLNKQQSKDSVKILQKVLTSFLGKDISFEIAQLIREPFKVKSENIFLSAVSVLFGSYKKFLFTYHIWPWQEENINLDFANRISQICNQNYQFASAWFFRMFAITVVVFTLTTGCVRKITAKIMKGLPLPIQ